MATFEERRGKVRAQIMRSGRRYSATFGTRAEAEGWAAAVKGTQLPVSLRQIAALPRYKKTSGVYFLFLANELIYVGQSKNLHSRVADHNIQFDEFSFVAVPTDKLDAVEAFFIDRLRPRLNRAGLRGVTPGLLHQPLTG